MRRHAVDVSFTASMMVKIIHHRDVCARNLHRNKRNGNETSARTHLDRALEICFLYESEQYWSPAARNIALFTLNQKKEISIDTCTKSNQLKSHHIELNCQFVTLNLNGWNNTQDAGKKLSTVIH